jgi:hypothetical protein
MRKKTVTSMIGLAALGLFGVMATAQASIVSGTSNIDFTGGTYTLSLADGAASYSFKDSMDGEYFDDAQIKSGNANSLVGAQTDFFGGGPAAYFTGSRAPYIDSNFPVNYLSQFKSFDSYATIDDSSIDTFLALAFNLDDGIHYGYAEVAGPHFLGYGYETVAGKGLRAGAKAPTPVPEPGSLAMLSLGLVLVGAGTVAARRRQKN